MRTLRLAAFGLSLALVLAVFGDTQAQVQKRQPDLKKIQDQLGRLQVGGPLISAEVKDKLNLTADQKDKIAKLEKEFDDKTKGANDKMRETIQKAIQDKDINALQNLRETTQANQKIRTDYQAKVTAVLNDEQKKKFEEAQKTTRRPGANLPNIPNVPNVRPLNRGGEQGLQSKEVQDQLKLSDDQKQKLEKLQKDFEAKTLEVLTEEQKKKFEELKKQPARPNRRPPGGE